MTRKSREKSQIWRWLLIILIAMNLFLIPIFYITESNIDASESAYLVGINVGIILGPIIVEYIILKR